MLTREQERYLQNLPEAKANKLMVIKPYNPKTKIIAQRILTMIKDVIPEADARFMGASALGISGQNDVDIYIMCMDRMKDDYHSKLGTILGKTARNEWTWEEEGVEISVYLSDPDDKNFREQIEIFEVFTHNPKALREYELLKESMNGKTYREYQIAKYGFYNRALGMS